MSGPTHDGLAEWPVSREAAQRAVDAKTKPLGALGALESAAIRIAMLQGTLAPTLDRARICVFGADHGIAEEGVSAYPRLVTAEMMRNFGRGGAAINVLARANDIELEVIDVGVDAELDSVANVRCEKVRRGSRNFLHEPAMTDEELDAALAVGANAARRAALAGVRALGLGEMGIGNSTAAAALLGALTGQPASNTVGRGTGVGDEMLAHKRIVVDRAIALHGGLDRGRDGRDCLRTLGGLELAAIAGAALEGARQRLVIVADGFISTVTVLCAAMMAASETPNLLPTLRAALFFAHRSAEHGHRLALDACGATLGDDARPLLDLELRLGEGTGAALAIPLLRSAAAMLREMATFDSAGVSTGEQDPHSAMAAGPS